MAAAMTLQVILALRDNLSAGLAQVQNRMRGVAEAGQALQGAGVKMMSAGAAGLAAMKGPVAAFADAEDAATRLKTALMGVGGLVAPEFQAINAAATALGNQLPGTTANFQSMMTTLLQQGVKAQDILGGVGKATAYLGVALKLPFEEAARFAARLSEAAGVASQDMMAFFDTIQRTANLGVATGEMEYAFSRSAGKLKELGIQGLSAANALAPLYANLIKTGLSGETVGTGMASILSNIQGFEYGLTKTATDAKATLQGLGIELSFLDKQGDFKGVENFIQQLEKLKGLQPEQLASVIKDMFGTGQDAQMIATIMDKGVAGYEEAVARMAAQATLQEKVNAQLGTLTNLWDAASGTFTNTLAAWAGALAPELKALTNWFGEVAVAISGFIEQHPLLAKWTAGIVAFGSAALVLGGALSLAAGSVLTLLGPLAALVSPIGLVVAAGAALIALNWDAIVAWVPEAIGRLSGLWEAFKAGIPGALAKGKELWAGLQAGLAPVGAALGRVWEGFKAALPGALATARELWSSLQAGASAAAPVLAGLGRGLADGLQRAGRFAQGFMQGFVAELRQNKEAAAALDAVMQGLGKALAWVGEKLAPLGNWLSQLIGPTTAAGDAAQTLGQRWGKAAAELLATIASLPGKIKAFVGDMLAAGAALIEGLIQGIMSKLEAAKAAIVGVGTSIKGWFTSALGIQSPSKVFAAFGGFLTQGLAGGIRAGAGQVLRQLGLLTGSVRAGIGEGQARLGDLVPPGLGAAAGRAARDLRQQLAPPTAVKRTRAAAALRRARTPAAPSRATAALKGAIPPHEVSLRSPAWRGPALPPPPQRLAGPAKGAAGAGGGANVVNFSPTIHVAGGKPEETKAAVTQALKLSQREFERVAAASQHAAARRGYV